MAYVGNVPAVAYTNTVKDTFSGNGSTVAFTLSVPSTTNNVRVVVENVIQDPTVAYGVSGTTLTFTSAPPSGTNNIYVVHLGPAVQTVQPPTQLSGNFTLTGDLAQTGDFTLTGAASVSGQLDTASILPTADATSVLGGASNRYTNLFLSGGVYLGGTGSGNLLDDYEEGTWTPTLAGSSTDPTGVSYNTQDGRYVKVAGVVFLNGFIGFTTYSGGSGNIEITGLPFSVPSGDDRWSLGSTTPENITFSAGYTYMTMRARAGTSALEPIQAGSNVVWSNVPLGSAPSSGTVKYFMFSVHYTVT
jgi:hypothetical protein